MCVAHNILAHIFVQNILARALATCGDSFENSKHVFCVIDILPVDGFPWKIQNCDQGSGADYLRSIIPYRKW